MDLMKSEHYNVIPIKGLTTEQWLEKRRMGIGGSDSPVVLIGPNNWSNPISLWLDKTGQTAISNEMTDRQRWGHIMEEPIITEYMRKYPEHKITRPKVMFQSKRYSFMLANLDGVVFDEGNIPGVVEVKNWGYPTGDWGYDGSDEIPESVFCQVNHNMIVTGFTWSLVIVFFGVSREMRRYFINRDDSLFANIIRLESDFWNDHVLADVPPEPSTSEECGALWKYDNGLTAVASEDEEAMFIAYLHERGEEKRAEERANVLRCKIEKIMKEKTFLISETGKKLVSWKYGTTSRVNTEKLKAYDMDAWRASLKDSESRTFRPNLKYS